MNRKQWRQLAAGNMFRGNDFACKVQGRFTNEDIWARIIGARRMNDRQFSANTFRIRFSKDWSVMDQEEWMSVMQHGFGAPDHLAKADLELMYKLNPKDCANNSPKDILGVYPRAGFYARCPNTPAIGSPLCDTHLELTRKEGGFIAVEQVRSRGEKIGISVAKGTPTEIYEIIKKTVRYIDGNAHLKFHGVAWAGPATPPTYEISVTKTHCGVCGASAGCMHPRDKRVTNRG